MNSSEFMTNLLGALWMDVGNDDGAALFGTATRRRLTYSGSRGAGNKYHFACQAFHWCSPPNRLTGAGLHRLSIALLHARGQFSSRSSVAAHRATGPRCGRRSVGWSTHPQFLAAGPPQRRTRLISPQFVPSHSRNPKVHSRYVPKASSIHYPTTGRPERENRYFAA